MRSASARRTALALGLALCTGAAEISRAAAPTTPDTGGAQGSFHPPLADTTTDAEYVAGMGLLALAGPMKLFGVIAGFGRPIGSRPNPLFGVETTFDVERGGATFAGLLPRDFGGPDLDLGIVQGGGSATLKCKPLDPRANGYVGLLFYAGLNLGFAQTSMHTGLGTAYTTSMLGGAKGGAVVEGRIPRIADVTLFGGYRLNSYLPLTVGMPSTTMKTPEYGGDVSFHLPYDLDLNLSSVFNVMRQGKEDKGVRVFLLGLTWQRGVGVAPILDGGA